MIDEMDRRILSLLQQDARLPNAEIARRVGMAPSATLERLRKLEHQPYSQLLRKRSILDRPFPQLLRKGVGWSVVSAR